MEVATLAWPSRFCISACRKACSEAFELLPDVSVEVEPLPVAAVVVVLVAADVDAAAAVVALEPVVVEAAVLAEPVGVSALTSAWKSCCSLAIGLSLELDDDPEALLDEELESS